MRTPLEQQDAKRLYWTAIFLYFGLLSFNTLATSIIASLIGTDWSGLNGQQKFLICAAVVANWTGLVLAFVRTSLGRIASGKPPIETGDTQYLTRNP